LLVGIFTGYLGRQADDRGVTKPLDDALSLFRERFDRQQTRSMRGDIIRFGKAHAILIGEDKPIAQQTIKLRHVTVQHSLAQLLFAVLYFGNIFQDDPPA